MKNITEKNTKKDILTAYNDALQKIKMLESQKVNKRQVVEKKEVQTKIEIASQSSVEDIVRSLANLRINANGTISDLEESILEKKSQLDDLNVAIDAQKENLKEVYEVSHEADSLAALLEAQESARKEFENEMAEKRAKLEAEVSKYEAELSERKTSDEKERTREKEEYKYKFKLEKDRANDEFEDEKRVRLRDFNEEMAERESAVEVREKEVVKLELRITELEEMIAGEDERRENEVEEAVASALKSEKTSRHFEVSALKKDMANAEAIFTNKIEILEQKIDSLVEENKDLRDTLKEANINVQTIASEAIKGAQARIIQPSVNSSSPSK